MVILDQVQQGRVVIDNSQLVDEAKAGVRAALDAVAGCFAVENLQGSLGTLQNQAPGFISNLVILLSAAGLPTNESTPEDALSLADEIDALVAAFDDPQLDPVVRDVARKHLVVLSTLLRHIPIFGVEAALFSYFELVTRLRRADIKTTPEAQSKLDPLFTKVRTWGERLGVLDKALNDGARLLQHADKAKGLLEYMPDLTGVV